MKIELITQDFKDSEYISNTDCPLARALKRYFPDKDIEVGGSSIIINKVYYRINIDFWDDTIVDSLIKVANEDQEVSYTLNIPEL